MARSSYPVGSRGVTLGRSETRDIVVVDPASSRHHSTIFPQEGRYVCRDMGSANGTYVNGQRIRETFLTDGDRKSIGPGGFVMLPRNGWHAVWNSGDTDAILLVGTSAGKFDDFFDAVAMAVAKAGELTPPQIGAIVGRVGSERGICQFYATACLHIYFHG